MKFNLIFSMTYRTSFLLELSLEMLYTATVIILFNVIYSNIRQLGGWSYYEIMFLMGLDVIMSEAFVGIVFALNTNQLPESIKNGTVDTVLLKPINSQFALTISRAYLPSIITMIPGFYLLYYSVSHIHRALYPANVIVGIFVLVCGFVIAYSFMTIASSLAFYFTNAQFFPRIGMNMIMFFQNRPYTIFNNLILKSLFFFIVPVIFVASVPTSTILGKIEWPFVVTAAGLATFFLLLSIFVWNKMIVYYSSATS